MRVRLYVFLLVASAGFGGTLRSQEAQPQAQPAQRTMRVPDGGTSGRMESIFVPPKAGAPFTLTLATEWSRPMANGGSFTLANERRIVRDSKGRIYQERWILVPKGSKVKSFMDIFQITDPEQHTWYNCLTASKECKIFNYGLETTDKFAPAVVGSGPLPDGNGVRQNDDLGESSTAGLPTHGYRETTTLNAGVMGNDRPMVTTREFWYSAQLGFNLLSMVDDPQNGKQVFTVKDLSTSEPELSYFEVPEGYRVVDHRNDK
ncbi:MAG TPA: hypothetical protein VGG85_09930 [Terracidiphilus sp.]